MNNSSKISIDTEVRDSEWLKFIQKCPQKNIFQTPYMRDVYAKTKYYKPFCFFAFDENDEIVSSMLANTIRENVPLSYFSRRVIIEGGPLFLENKIGELAATSLVEKLAREMEKHAIFVEIRNHRLARDFGQIFKRNEFSFIDHLNIHIDLTKEKETLWKNMHKQRRAGVRRSLRRGVLCKFVKTEDDMKALYNILKKTYNHKRVPLADESLFMAILNELVPKNLARPFLLQVGTIDIAGFIPLLFDGKITEYYTSGLREYSAYCANELAVWKLLEWGSENNFKVFDFLGAGDPKHSYGVRNFKARFGGEMVNYGRYISILHPFSYKISQYCYKTWRILKGISSKI